MTRGMEAELLIKWMVRTVKNAPGLIDNTFTVNVLERGSLHPDPLTGHFNELCQPVFIGQGEAAKPGHSAVCETRFSKTLVKQSH